MCSFSAVSCPNTSLFDPSLTQIFALVSLSNALTVALNVPFNFNGLFPEYVNILSVLFCNFGFFLSFQYVVSIMMLNIDPLSTSMLMIVSFTQIGYTGLLLFLF